MYIYRWGCVPDSNFGIGKREINEILGSWKAGDWEFPEIGNSRKSPREPSQFHGSQLFLGTPEKIRKDFRTSHVFPGTNQLFLEKPR